MKINPEASITELLQLSSVLPKTYREQLEAVFFLNPRQCFYREQIRGAVEEYGQPRLVEDNGGLRIQVAGLKDVQCIFATIRGSRQSSLVGVAVLYRISEAEVILLHIAISETLFANSDHTMDPSLRASGTLVAVEFLGRILTALRQIKGVERLRYAYRRSVTLPVIPLRHTMRCTS